MRLLAAANKARLLLKPTALAYDAAMLKQGSFEQQDRESHCIRQIIVDLKLNSSLDKCKHVPTRTATVEELKVLLHANV